MDPVIYHECKHQLRAEAEFCPICGAKVSAPKKPIYLNRNVQLGIVAMAIVVAAAAYGVAKVREAGKAAEERAAETKNAALLALRSNAVRAVEQNLKRDFKDPDSLKWKTVLSNDNGTVLCLEYRTRNRSGFYVRRSLIVAEGKMLRSADAWNEHCFNHRLYDMKYLVNETR
ncbi:MAG: hypothetical protein WBX11_12025 [Thiobacillaceae bacterium]